MIQARGGTSLHPPLTDGEQQHDRAQEQRVRAEKQLAAVDAEFATAETRLGGLADQRARSVVRLVTAALAAANVGAAGRCPLETGLSRRETGDMLGLSPVTVRRHASELARRLGAAA